MSKHQQFEDYEPQVTKKIKDQSAFDININYDDQEKIMQALEEADQFENSFTDLESFQKLLSQIEQHIQINQDLRAKYNDKPEKFIESEVDLDEDIRLLSSLSAYPELFVPFSKSNALQNIILLMQHENNDISLDVIKFFQELVSSAVEPEYADGLLFVYDQLVNNFIFESIVDCIIRFGEGNVEESEGIHQCMSILESLIEIKTSYCKEICQRTKILSWLSKRLSMQDNQNGKVIDDIKLYASEILVQLLQGSNQNIIQFGLQGGIDDLLLGIQGYRTAQSYSAEDTETVQNMFNALEILLFITENRQIFYDCEGIQLMIKIISSKSKLSFQAIKTIAASLNGLKHACQLFIDLGGLRYLFPILLQKGIKSINPKIQKEIDDSTLIILKYLIKQCEDIYLERVLCKLEDQQLVNRLFQIKMIYSQLLDLPNNYQEKVYYSNLEKGLTIVENCDVIILDLLTHGNENVLFQYHPYKTQKLILEKIEQDKITFTNGSVVELLDEK